MIENFASQQFYNKNLKMYNLEIFFSEQQGVLLTNSQISDTQLSGNVNP